MARALESLNDEDGIPLDTIMGAMRPDLIIRSRSNPLLQRVGAVLAGKERESIVLEGDRLVDDAIGAKWKLEIVLVSHERADRAAELEKKGQSVRIVDAGLLARVGNLKSSPGIVAIAAAPRAIDLASMSVDAQTLLLVVSGVGDPGNLGALARAAEAFGASALAVIQGSASPWNEKALRGSMGSLLRLPVATDVDARACAASLSKRNVRHVLAATRGGSDPSRFDWKGPLALWITGETGELPDVAARFERVTIPIAKSVESLNVTVAASVLLYASGRVRNARG